VLLQPATESDNNNISTVSTTVYYLKTHLLRKKTHTVEHDNFCNNFTVTVTKVFILRFLLKDRKRITESFTYIQ